MADCSDGGGSITEVMLSGDVNFDALMKTEQTEEKASAEESGANILGEILGMEAASADLKEDDNSIMAALAECGEDIDKDDEEDYENKDEEAEEDTDSDDQDEEEEEEDAEFEGDESENDDPSRNADEALDFGEMPDFSSMMEAEGSSVLEGAVEGDIDLKSDQASEILDAAAIKIKSEPGSNDGKSVDQEAGKKRKRKSSGNVKKQAKMLKKGKRKKKKKAGKDCDTDSRTLKASERRRNIRKIIGEKDLEKETLDAQKEELERQQRLMELKRQAMSNMSATTTSKPSTFSNTTSTSAASWSSGVKEQDSQLKSLLQSAEEEADKQEKKKDIEKLEKKKAEIIPAIDIKTEVSEKEEKVDVIELSSDSEAENDANNDDCVMVQSSDEEEREQGVEAEDLNDGGAHINDEQNCPDDQGRVLVNVGHPKEDPDIFLSPQMAKAIKPHQIGGVRFLYDNLVESLPRFNTSQGFGCILAHSMGLGKTIQVISFIDIFLRHTTAKKVLCIVPINTLQNWVAEFNMWAPEKKKPHSTDTSASKSKDTEKKTEKKSRERGKKSKGSKTDIKSSKGQTLPGTYPTADQMGMDLTGMTEMRGISGPGMDPFQGQGMNLGGGSFVHMGGHGVNSPGGSSDIGQVTGPGLGHSGYIDQRRIMGMQGMNIDRLTTSGGSFVEMPWMDSTTQSNQFSNFSGPLYSPSQQNPLGVGTPGHSQVSSSGMMPSPSLSQSVNSLRTSEAVNASSDARFRFSSVNSLSSACNSLTAMQNVNPSGALSSTNSMNSLGDLMDVGDLTSAENSLGVPSPANHSGISYQNSPLSTTSNGKLIGASMELSETGHSNVLEESLRGSPMSCVSMNSVISGTGNDNPDSNGLEKFMERSDRHPDGAGMGKFIGSGLVDSSGSNKGGSSSGIMNNSESLKHSMSSGMSLEDNVRMASNMDHRNAQCSESSVNSSLLNTTCSMNISTNSYIPPFSTLSSDMSGISTGVPSAQSPASAPSSSVSVSVSCAADANTCKDGEKSESGEQSCRNDSSTNEVKMETKDNCDENKGKEWMKIDGILREESDTREMRYRNYKVFLLNDSCKATAQRAKIIGEWNEVGGVLLMGYEMYRLLSNRRSLAFKPKKKTKAKSGKGQQPDVIDVDEEDRNKNFMTDIHGALVNPGPELVICDEGHRIKNNHASISQALKQISTRRRVVLTGYPLQNNLMEYWCMVDFVRPNFLGNKTEFSNMFERPIMNGQCQDSTADDRRLMKHRAYVLHNLLEGFVQRRSHVVLQRALPMKHEYVFLIRMSPIQRKLYRRYIESLEEAAASLAQANSNPLKAFAVGCKIWNHPDILHKSVVLKKTVVEDIDLDIEPSETGGGKKKLKKTESSSSLASMSSAASSTPNVSAASLSAATSSQYSSGADFLTSDGTNNSIAASDFDEDSVSRTISGGTGISSAAGGDVPAGLGTAESGSNHKPWESESSSPAVDKKEEENTWVGDAFKDYEPGVLEHGPKMVLLYTIIEESLRIGNKILVFSQSLSTLDIIEEFLSKRKVPRPDMDENWSKNRSYFRLDGSTSSTERERLINEFNRPSNTLTWVFLVSTKAGCLGINLIGANRVVVLDASWNPCHDCQAVCRVFRFGQARECFIYRLVTENTLERNIYDRQITKQGMADRVVDEMNPDNHYSKRQIANLLKNEDKDFPYLDFSTCEDSYEDPVLISTLKKQGQWITKKPFTHESLLIDRKELRMTLKEKRQAREGYARDKRNNVTYSRPSYAAYYPGGAGGSQMYVRRNPAPLSSIRPSISTPMPRQHFVKPGVSVTQVITTTDILLPGTNTATSAGAMDSSNKIPAGQKIIVIKTPKGVYIRTHDGKMFAVRSKSADDKADSGKSPGTYLCGASTTTTTTISSGLGSSVSSPQLGDFFFKPPEDKQIERNLHDMKSISSYMGSMYSHTGHVNTLMRKNNRRQQSSIRPTLPVPNLSGARSSVFGSASAVGKNADFTEEMMGLPHSRGSPSWRTRQVSDIASSPADDEVPKQKDAMSVFNTTDNMDLSVYRPDPVMPRPPMNRSSGKMADSQMMKLLMSDEEGERVGRTAMATSAVPGRKSSNSYSSVHQSRDMDTSFMQSNPNMMRHKMDDMAVPSGKHSFLPHSPLPWDMAEEDESSQNSSDSNASLPQPYSASLASTPVVSPSEHFSQSPLPHQIPNSALSPLSGYDQQDLSPHNHLPLPGNQEPSDSQSHGPHQIDEDEDSDDFAQWSATGQDQLNKLSMFNRLPSHLSSSSPSLTFSDQSAKPIGKKQSQQQFSSGLPQGSISGQQQQSSQHLSPQPFTDQSHMPSSKMMQQSVSREQQQQYLKSLQHSDMTQLHGKQKPKARQKQSRAKQPLQGAQQLSRAVLSESMHHSSSPQPQSQQSGGRQSPPYTPPASFPEQTQQRLGSQKYLQNPQQSKSMRTLQNESSVSDDIISAAMGLGTGDYLQDQMENSQPGTPSDHGSPSGGLEKMPSEVDKIISFTSEEGRQPQSSTSVYPNLPSQPFTHANLDSYNRTLPSMRGFTKKQLRGRASVAPNFSSFSVPTGLPQEPSLNIGSSSAQDLHSFGMMYSSSDSPGMDQGLGVPASYPSVPDFYTGSTNSPFSQDIRLGRDGNSSFNNSRDSSPGMYGIGEQSSDSLGSIGALFHDSPDPRHAQQLQGSNGSSVNSLGNDFGLTGLVSNSGLRESSTRNHPNFTAPEIVPDFT